MPGNPPHVRSIGYYAAFIGLGLVGAVLGPTLPGLAQQTRSSIGQISILFTARSLGFMLGSLRGGLIYDRIPGHPVLAAVLLLIAGALFVAPLMPLLWLLALVVFVWGVGESMVDIGGNTLLVWLHGRQVAPYMNGLHFFFGLGAFLSPLIIAQAIAVGSIRWAYWALALLMLPSAILVLGQPSPLRAGQAQDGSQRSVSHRLVALLILFFMLTVAAELAVGGWVFTYAIAKGLASEATAAYLTSTFWGALTLGRLLGIPIAQRFRPDTVLLADLLGALSGVTLILLWPDSLAMLWIGTFGLGLSIASIFPTTINLAERRLTITGRVTGFFLFGASAGSMSLPWLIGQLFEPIGPQVAPLAVAVDLILAVVVLAVLVRWAGHDASAYQTGA